MSNVVLIMSDEHNHFVSSVAGHDSVKTPNVQRMADNGSTYKNTYCPSPLCLPSRSAFMAGRRVHTIQAYNNCNAELRYFPTYGEVLKNRGVHTAYIGKTDVYAPGKELGFSEMMMPQNRAYPGDTNQRRSPLAIREGSANRADGYGPREEGAHNDERCVDRAISWLRNRPEELDNPWVLTVNVTNPHFPHKPPQDLWEMYEGMGDLPDHGPECASANHPFARDLRRHFETDQFNEKQIRGLRQGYYGCVTYVDQQIGRLLNTLEKTGLKDNTNVIYTSDHGEMLGKFGMWWKCTLYEDSVRVPCIAAGPDFASGCSVSTPIDLLDVQATLFESTGAERPDDWVGAPLQSIDRNDSDRAVFCEYHGHGTRASGYVIRRGPWKYIHYVNAPDQLFNLDEDPDELDNRAEDCPGMGKDLHEELTAICAPMEEHRRAEKFIERQLQTVGA